MTEIEFREEKDKLQELRKEQDLLHTKFRLAKENLKDYKRLQYRSTCPCCQQATDREYYESLIPITEAKIDDLQTKVVDIYREIENLAKPIWEARNEFNKEREVIRQAYLLHNRNRVNKTIRDYNNDKDVYMPDITDKAEQELWNWAMECQLANRDLDDTNEELMFDIN